MATVVNSAFPGDASGQDTNIVIRESVADSHIPTQDTDGATTAPAGFVAEDDRQPEIAYES